MPNQRKLILALILLLGLLPLAANGLRGGPALFQTDMRPACPVPMNSLTDPTAGLALPFRPMPSWQQYLAVTAGFGVKAVYMLMSLVLVFLLRRQTKPDLTCIRWSCLFFFAGEAACAINYFVFGERSYLMEYLHSFGMVLAFAAGIYAVMELVDTRLIHFSAPDQRCQLAALCCGCAKQRPDHPCGLRRLLTLGLPMLALLASLPLASAFHTDAYATDILGTRYIYMHPLAHQQYEIRDLPVLAILLLCVAWLRLQREAHPFAQTRLLAAAGLGVMGFSFFRWILLAAFATNQLWFVAWEEFAELLSICAIVGLLWAFRLVPPSRQEP